jgi:hypothetical protein
LFSFLNLRVKPAVGARPLDVIAIRTKITYLAVNEAVINAGLSANTEIHGRAAAVSVQIAFTSYNFASFVFAAETVVEAVAKSVLENGADDVDNVRSLTFCHCWKRKLRKVFFAILFPNLK